MYNNVVYKSVSKFVKHFWLKVNSRWILKQTWKLI